jgi:septal ring-binding cell division protein DamX
MEEQHTADEQSHYEISLTAGQAFVAFVLLMLSLAASFAFGLMLGKGQTDERLVVRKENPVVTEASIAPRTNTGEIVDVSADEFSDEVAAPSKRAQETADDPDEPTLIEEDAKAEVADVSTATRAAEADPEPVAPRAEVAALADKAVEKPAEKKPEPVRVAEAKPAPVVPVAAKASTERIPHYAQLLSTGDQKTAEGLAVKLINRGFTTAYVERGSNEKGPVYRVRVRFASENDARSAETKLREFSKDVWITSR